LFQEIRDSVISRFEASIADPESTDSRLSLHSMMDEILERAIATDDEAKQLISEVMDRTATVPLGFFGRVTSIFDDIVRLGEDYEPTIPVRGWPALARALGDAAIADEILDTAPHLFDAEFERGVPRLDGES
jgi:hypothetical protein